MKIMPIILMCLGLVSLQLLDVAFSQRKNKIKTGKSASKLNKRFLIFEKKQRSYHNTKKYENNSIIFV